MSVRCSSAQVVEDKRRRDKLKCNLEVLKKREVKIMAEIEVQQEMANEEEEQNAIKTLTKVENIKDDIQMLEPTEDFTCLEYTNDTEIEKEETPKATAKSIVCWFPVTNRHCRC
jgi:hypothetical protein